MKAREGDSRVSDTGLHLQHRDDGIAVLTLDLPDERMNVLRADLLDALSALLGDLAPDAAVQGIVIASGKPDSFIAGADVRLIADCQSASEATHLASELQRVFDDLEAFPKPVVAAIHGTCLGGGLELALACRGRVASDHPKTALGLPEVQLGILPGGGGTQRLPKLIGIADALDMMLTGRHVPARRAARLGLVDDLVDPRILVNAAARLVRDINTGEQPRRPRSAARLLLEGNPLGRRLVFSQARKKVQARTHGNYPAPPHIIECVQHGIDAGIKQGLELEARRFGELAVTPEARELMHVYFASVAMKKDRGTSADVGPRDIRRTAVIGAGLMGSGIAFVTSTRAGLPVRLKDVSTQALNRGMGQIDGLIQRHRRRSGNSRFEAGLQLRRITPTLDFSGFRSADIVFEAVFEDLELKHETLRAVEIHCGDHTIFATNTSSLPISQIAEAASRPGNVVGMHYFSPVEKMPLLEVIAAEQTDPEVIATAVATGRRQGKNVIVVRDVAGFYVNRILFPYVTEASMLLLEGVGIDHIDRALTRFGFPLGPFALLDEVGLDVAAKVAEVLHDAFGERMTPAKVPSVMLQDGRRGKKSGKGFYRRDRGKKSGRRVDESVYRLLQVKPGDPPPAADIVDRCVLPMINEAVRCLEESVIRSVRDGDMGALFGIGFPPFRGGPFRYLDNRGITAVVNRLQELRKLHGERFAPAERLLRMATEGETFHPR